tara:strand:- start:465 stop:710 length:246 start_codon:yes stop_codon:yes gene_type:complete
MSESNINITSIEGLDVFLNVRNSRKIVDGETTSLTQEDWDKLYENRDVLHEFITEQVEEYLSVWEGVVPQIITQILEDKDE